MKTKEFILFFLSIIPLIFVLTIWKDLPQQVPMHWNSEGNVDRMGNKIELLILQLIFPQFIYWLLRLVPKIDPKKFAATNPQMFFTVRIIIQIFISLLFSYIVLMTWQPAKITSDWIFPLIGLFFSAIGWTFNKIKPNYFVGLRTPWTLENPIVWEKTHRFASKIWIVGGGLIFLSYFIIKFYLIVFFTLLVFMVFVPLIYSYKIFQKLK